MDNSNQDTNIDDGELDLFQLFKILWTYKFQVVFLTAGVAIFSVFYALSLPNIYESESVLTPVQQGGGQSSQAGGIAALVGINLNEANGNNIDVTLETSKSFDFYKYLNKKRGIDKYIVAVDHYSYTEDKLYFDEAIFNSEENKWVVDSNGESSQPSLLKSYKAFKKDHFFFVRDKITGLIEFKFEHQSPRVSKQVLDFIIKDLNQYIRDREIIEARDSIKFIELQISKTPVPEVRKALAKLIELKAQKMMIGETTDEYALKIIQSPIEPEAPAYPSRRIICIVITLLGGVLSSLFVLIFHQIRNRKT
jgi:LPS O-antigen subunit length determinant protein (WzzB/FepE family)